MMGRKIRILVCLLLGILLSLNISLASSVQTTGDVNIRSGPGLNYSVLGTLRLGTTVTYLDESKADQRGVAWYKISYGNITGWVSSRYSVITDGQSSMSSTGSAVIITGDVNLRSGPGLQYDVISSISSGSTITYLNGTTNDERGVAWFKVSYSGISGWVSSKYAHLAGASSSNSSPTWPSTEYDGSSYNQGKSSVSAPGNNSTTTVKPKVTTPPSNSNSGAVIEADVFDFFE